MAHENIQIQGSEQQEQSQAEQGGGISVDISKKPAEPVKPPISTQTSTEETQETAPKEGETSGADDTETGSPDEGQGEDAADAEGKYVHPETKAKVSADDMISYYKGKFAGSTSGANELLGKNETLTKEIGEVKATSDSLKKEMEEVREIAAGKNPEGLQLHDLNKKLTDTTNALALEKEERALDNFFGSVKIEGAASRREALRALARSNPSTPLQKLWDENLKAAAESDATKAAEKRTSQKKNASEKTTGTSTREPAGETVGNTGLTLKQFNALPVAERQKLLAKG